jgi:hypothetical protein
MVISWPGLASHRKFEQMPFLAGSSAPASGSQYTARRTHREVCRHMSEVEVEVDDERERR